MKMPGGTAAVFKEYLSVLRNYIIVIFHLSHTCMGFFSPFSFSSGSVFYFVFFFYIGHNLNLCACVPDYHKTVYQTPLVVLKVCNLLWQDKQHLLETRAQYLTVLRHVLLFLFAGLPNWEE